MRPSPPSPRRKAFRLVLLAGGAALLFGYVFLPLRVAGPGMEPAYRSGDLAFVNAFAFALREPARGDVVALSLAGRSVVLLTRVVGLPGEKVGFRSGVLYVDDEPVPEPWAGARTTWTSAEALVGPDELFVAPDDRSGELADRGRVRRARIVGGPLW